jgi:hypothetical protein
MVCQAAGAAEAVAGGCSLRRLQTVTAVGGGCASAPAAAASFHLAMRVGRHMSHIKQVHVQASVCHPMHDMLLLNLVHVDYTIHASIQ